MIKKKKVVTWHKQQGHKPRREQQNAAMINEKVQSRSVYGWSSAQRLCRNTPYLVRTNLVELYHVDPTPDMQKVPVVSLYT